MGACKSFKTLLFIFYFLFFCIQGKASRETVMKINECTYERLLIIFHIARSLLSRCGKLRIMMPLQLLSHLAKEDIIITMTAFAKVWNF